MPNENAAHRNKASNSLKADEILLELVVIV